MMTKQEYKGYELHESNGIQYPFKARPYDDADYYYAQSTNGIFWRIGYKGRLQRIINGTFEQVVDVLEDLNKNIEPKMLYN